MTKNRRARAEQAPVTPVSVAGPPVKPKTFKDVVAKIVDAPKPRPKTQSTALVVVEPQAPVIEPKPVSTHVMTLWSDWPSDRCRKPVFSGRIVQDEQIFCGKPVPEGASYCLDCQKVLYLPTKRQRTEAEKKADMLRFYAQRKKALSR